MILEQTATVATKILKELWFLALLFANTSFSAASIWLQNGWIQLIIYLDMSRSTRFPTMWHFDMNRLRRACAASF